MPFKHFPWFRDATVNAVMKVELAGPGHLYWPDLDVDLAVDSIDHPERFPLVSQPRPKRRCKRRRASPAARKPCLRRARCG
jgi:hypothetical protein